MLAVPHRATSLARLPRPLRRAPTSERDLLLGRGEPQGDTSLPEPSRVPMWDIATIAGPGPLTAQGGDARPAWVTGRIRRCCRGWFAQRHPPWFPQGQPSLMSSRVVAAGTRVPWPGRVLVPV